MRTLVAAVLALPVVVACTTPRPASDATVVYETRARAGERVVGPPTIAARATSGHDPRDSVRARADEVRSRAAELSGRAATAGVDRFWREDLGHVDDRTARLFERIEALDDLERKGEDVDYERQWDGVFAEVQDLLASLDELEDDLARAEGPGGGGARNAAP